MRILVTGGAGFIGSHVVDAFLRDGHEVAVVDNLSTGSSLNLNPAAAFYKMDIRHPTLEQVLAWERPEVVCHYAARVNVRQSMIEPEEDAGVNIVGSVHLLECARRAKVRKIIYISSAGAPYGEPEYLPCDENHPSRLICPHGISKYTVEHYLHLYHVNYGLECSVLRYPNVYGPRQDPAGENGVVAIFASRMLAGKPVVIYGDGEQERDYLYVADCVTANLLALKSRDNGIFNLGWNRGTTVNDIYDALRNLTGYTLPAVHVDPTVGEIRKIRVSAERAKRQLGWHPQVSLGDGLSNVVEYLRQSEAIPVGAIQLERHPSPAVVPE